MYFIYIFTLLRKLIQTRDQSKECLDLEVFVHCTNPILKSYLINKTKTVAIIFWRTSKIKVKYHIPNILEFERVDSVKLLGVFLTSNISWSLQINHLVTGITRKFYILNQIKHMSLNSDGLNNVFRAMVLSRIQYALPVYSWKLTPVAILTELTLPCVRPADGALRPFKLTSTFLQGVPISLYSMRYLKGSHCLNKLLPSKKNNVNYSLRSNNILYDIPLIRNSALANSFIFRCLQNYSW